MRSQGLSSDSTKHALITAPTASKTALEPEACEKRAIDWYVVALLLALILSGVAQGIGLGMVLR
jgi:hypothetical protein